MRKFIIILITCLFSLACYSQITDQRYVSRMTQDGTLFFINPHKLKNLSEIKKFEYDMTLLTWTDSVTVNFTFESNFMTVPDTVKIISGDRTFYSNSYKPLFIDLKKDHYEIRISALFPISELEYIINSSLPPCFEIYQDGNKETATYKLGAWRKDQKKLSNIYNLYMYSK